MITARSRSAVRRVSNWDAVVPPAHQCTGSPDVVHRIADPPHRHEDPLGAGGVGERFSDEQRETIRQFLTATICAAGRARETLGRR